MLRATRAAADQERAQAESLAVFPQIEDDPTCISRVFTSGKPVIWTCAQATQLGVGDVFEVYVTGKIMLAMVTSIETRCQPQSAVSRVTIRRIIREEV